MIGRSRQVLNRFPAHYEAARAGKQFEVVVDALASSLDGLSVDMARVRRSHRLADADELRDLQFIAALHGITPAELEILVLRWGVAQAAVAALQKAPSGVDREKLAERLIGLWGIDAAKQALPLYAPAGAASPDLDAAKARLLNSAAQALSRAQFLNGVRARVATISAIHAQGNGTVRAVLQGAANAVDLDLVGEIQNSKDRFWHAALVHDRLQLTRPVVKPATSTQPAMEVETPFAPATEVIGIEENPLERNATDPIARHHGELFSVVRRGFDRALLEVHITGKENKTVAPMVVNRDEGAGVGYSLPVPAGKSLVFTEDGRAFLDNNDVTAFAYAWQGACFAGTDSRPTDFTFDDPRSVFVQATPPPALDPDFTFPHAGDSLPVPDIAVGETRLAFFVQQGYFSAEEGDPPALRPIVPRTAVAFLDDSVFASASGSDFVFDSTLPEAGIVSLSWLEHRAYCIRVVLPHRFRRFTPDDKEGAETTQRVAQALERFAPAGIEVRVEFSDRRWILGQGILSSGTADDLLSQVRPATMLWGTPHQ